MTGSKVLYRIHEAAEVLSLSKSALYEQIRAGRLRIVHEGRSSRVTAQAIREYVELLEREALARECRKEAC